MVKTTEGWWGLCASSQGLAAVIWPAPGPEAARTYWPQGAAEGSSELLGRAADQLRAYLSGARTGFDLPLDLGAAGPFTRRVLEACARIGYGEVRSYGDLAAAVGNPGAARAVGRALAANPLPVVIPCHRVIGADGALRGFGGGIDRKAQLLAREGLPINGGKLEMRPR